MFTICSDKLSALIWETGCQFMENLSNCQFSIRCLTVWCVPSTDLPGRFCLRRLFTVFPRLLCHSCFGFTVCSTAVSTFSTPCLNSKSFLHVVNHMFLPHESNLISEVALWKSLMVPFLSLPLSDSHTISFLCCTFAEIYGNLLILGNWKTIEH